MVLRKRPPIRSAFTLIEMVITCLIVAMLAGVVTMSVRGRIMSIRLTQANEQIERADRFARSLAVSRGVPVKLVLDGNNKLRVRTKRRTHKTIQLPEVLNVSLRTNRRVRSRSEIAISPLGQSASYALELRVGPKQSGFVLVSGVSGQTLRTRNSGQVDALLRL